MKNRFLAMKIMFRNITLFFLLAIALQACKKDDDNQPVEDPRAENKQPLGASAEDILSNSTYQKLTVELVYSEFYKPTQQTINHFKDFINGLVNKSQGVVFVETVVEEQPNDPFTIEEIKEIEDRVRTQYTEGNNIAIYVFFSNGSSQNDTQTRVTLGTAYRNTSMVIYERTIKVVTNEDSVTLPLLETTTVEHEFGHILGLTNIQNDDIHESHEDLENLKHCKVEGRLMYYDATNVTKSSVRNFVQGRNSVPVFDPLCLEDLDEKRGL